MSKTNNTTVQIPINNTAASYSVVVHVYVEVTGQLAGLSHTTLS